MSIDLFEQLADLAVPEPPPPAQFDAGVHRRLNKRLLAGQLLDFALHAIPFAFVHLLPALVGLVRLTVTGKFEVRPDRAPPNFPKP